MVNKSAAIHSQLTELVLEGKGIDAITGSLAQIVDNPVAVEDVNFQLISLAGFTPEEGDEQYIYDVPPSGRRSRP